MNHGISYDIISTGAQKAHYPQLRFRILNQTNGTGRTILHQGETPEQRKLFHHKPHAYLEVLVGPCSTKFWAHLEDVRHNHESLVEARQALALAEAAAIQATQLRDGFLTGFDPSYGENATELERVRGLLNRLDEKEAQRKEAGQFPLLFKDDLTAREYMRGGMKRLGKLVHDARGSITQGLEGEQKERHEALEASMLEARNQVRTAKTHLANVQKELTSRTFAAAMLKRYLQLHQVAVLPDDMFEGILEGRIALYELEEAAGTTQLGVPVGTRSVTDKRGTYQQQSRCTWLKTFNWETILTSMMPVRANVPSTEGTTFVCCTQNARKQPASLLLGERPTQDEFMHQDDCDAYLIIVQPVVWRALLGAWDEILRREEVKHVAALYPTTDNAHLLPAPMNTTGETEEAEEPHGQAPTDETPSGEPPLSAAPSN